MIMQSFNKYDHELIARDVVVARAGAIFVSRAFCNLIFNHERAHHIVIIKQLIRRDCTVRLLQLRYFYMASIFLSRSVWAFVCMHTNAPILMKKGDGLL